MGFKRVAALERCFSALDLLAAKKRPLGISDIAGALGLHKSTVYNTLHTLAELGVLENKDGRFRFGPKLYMLGKAAEEGSGLIRTVHPYLEKISRETKLSAFLGMRTGMKAVILDKADSTLDFKISSELGLRIPLVAGAHGKAFLSQLPDPEVDRLLSGIEIRKFTSNSCTSKTQYKEMVRQAREQGVAWDDEEYMEGVRALAVPLDTGRREPQTALWVVGVNGVLKKEMMAPYSELLKDAAGRIKEELEP